MPERDETDDRVAKLEERIAVIEARLHVHGHVMGDLDVPPPADPSADRPPAPAEDLNYTGD